MSKKNETKKSELAYGGTPTKAALLTLVDGTYQTHNPAELRSQLHHQLPANPGGSVSHLQSLRDREYRALEHIISQMEAEGYKPTMIIGLSRGGLVPAVVLSHALHVPLTPISWSLRDHVHTDFPFDAEKRVLSHLEENEDNRVLVIDDICDSGETFKEIQRNFSGVVTLFEYACIYKRKGSGFDPRFVGEHIVGEDWIDFSWEMEGVQLASETDARAEAREVDSNLPK